MKMHRDTPQPKDPGLPWPDLARVYPYMFLHQ